MTKKTNIPEVWRLMQFMERTSGNIIGIILYDTLTNCNNRANNENLPSSAGKKIKFHFVYSFAQPQNSMNNILRPPTWSSTFHLTQNISDAESPVVRTASLSTRSLRHSL